MSGKNDTIADIVAEMRGLVKPGETLNHTYELLNGLSDRLEAAWKREKTAIEADALAVGGLVEASRATTENLSAVGDAAKLREALGNSNVLLEELATIGEWGESAREQIAENNSALAAPPRNCDRFGTDNAEASLAYEEFCDRAEVEESVNGAIAWLLSLDADKEGGNDGR